MKQQQFSVEKIQAQPVSPPELFSWEEKFGPDWNEELVPLEKFIGKNVVSVTHEPKVHLLQKLLLGSIFNGR